MRHQLGIKICPDLFVDPPQRFTAGIPLIDLCTGGGMQRIGAVGYRRALSFRHNNAHAPDRSASG
jgi:hypothetical protein